MRRNRALDRDGTARAAHHRSKLSQNASHALCLEAVYARLCRASRGNARLVRIDGEAKAAEAPSEAAIHVEKAEMQTSRCPDSDAIDHRAWEEGMRACFARLALYTAQKSSACNI